MASNSAAAGLRAHEGGAALPGGAGFGPTVSEGLLGGLVGAGTIWVYEAAVWVGVQHLMPLPGIPRKAVGLVFGRGVQDGLGALSYPLGTAIHLAFALAWGVLFALIWPSFRHLGWEATLLALFFAVAAWVAMHVAIAVTSSTHPDYFDPNVVIGGNLSHIFFTVPLALVVKRRLG